MPDAATPAGPASSLEDKPAIVGPPPNEMGARLATIAVASALLMEFLDSTALSTAMPTLARAFHTDPIHLKLALTSYILALAVVVPASGWMADRFGPRRIFLGAMSAFLLGSMLCGFAHSLGELVLFRIIQGIGGGMMTPVGRLIVLASAPRDKLVAAMSWYTMPALVGPLLGPPIAGFILSVASWQWIFFVNIPIGVLGAAAVIQFVPQLKRPDPGRFDIKGFLLASLAISTIVFATETAGLSILPLWLVAILGLIALGSSAAFIYHALNTEKPVLNIRLFRFPTLRAALIGGLLVRLGIGATPFLLPLLLQVGLGWSPLKAGLVSIFTALGAFLSKPVLPGVIRRYGFRQTLIVANLAGAFLTATPAFFRDWTPIVVVMGLLALTGFVRSTQFTATNTVGYSDLPDGLVSNAATLSTVLQQIGLCLGISLGGVMLQLARGSSGRLTPDRFIIPFVAIGAITSLGGIAYRQLRKESGEMPKREPVKTVAIQTPS
jgi:EmrB/QacA subfamily drug resistance transporter